MCPLHLNALYLHFREEGMYVSFVTNKYIYLKSFGEIRLSACLEILHKAIFSSSISDFGYPLRKGTVGILYI